MDFSYLVELAMRFNAKTGKSGKVLPNLSIYSRDAISDIEATVYEPVMCLILQGSKMTSVGDQRVDLCPGDALVVSHDLPVVSRITMASPEKPYIALILSLDLGLVRNLYGEMADAPPLTGQARPLSASPAEKTLIAPLVRYLELMDEPLDVRILGPSILREIHYRLLMSPDGGMLRNLLVVDSHASRVARAIVKMRLEFREPLAVSHLAKTAGMSVSSFHEHFKSVTGTTPLQYQKDLRLIEARELLVNRGQAVSETAYAVGYESPTHFSRDYSKKFGLPPSKDSAFAVLMPV